MTLTTPATTRRSKGIYFFLSYAHTPPISDDVKDDTDHWVKVFYDDLRKQVKALATKANGADIGFVDYQLPPGSDWKAQLSQALGAAEVFVPLYSPRYLAMSWPLSERDAFQQRLAKAGPTLSTGHLQPVLWTPVVGGPPDPEVTEALRLGSDTPAYAENGLRAMAMLSIFHEQYQTVVARLARDIVRVAEEKPLGPSQVPAPSGTARPAQTSTPFVIAVIAPTAGTLPAGRSAEAYGESRAGWRPFGGAQVRPVAEYAANVAERLGLPTEIVDFASAEADRLADYPGVLLIDPWVLAQPKGRAQLRAAIAGAREWVTPLIVANRLDPQYVDRGATLSNELIGMLSDAGSVRPQDPRGVPIARDVEEFVQLMPTVVAQTRRKYLRLGPGATRTGAASGRPWRTADDSAPRQPRKKTDD